MAPLCAKGEAGPDPHTGSRSAPRQVAQSPGDELPRVPQGGLPTWPPFFPCPLLAASRAPPAPGALPPNWLQHPPLPGSAALLCPKTPSRAGRLFSFKLSKHRRLLFSLFFSFCIIAIFALFLALCARLVSAKWKLR